MLRVQCLKALGLRSRVSLSLFRVSLKGTVRASTKIL